MKELKPFQKTHHELNCFNPPQSFTEQDSQRNRKDAT